jgi:Tfp pilus assembly protein PilX
MLFQTKNSGKSKNREQGIALMFCLIALLILTAITTSLVLMSGTDTTVNANYRSEETAFFAAKAGIYEALDRMQQSNAHSISASLPTTTSGVLYLINSGSSLTVQPWTTTNTYVDDELCHEGISIGTWPTSAQILPPDVPCTSLPTGSTWYTTTTSNYPWSGTAAAMPYEWVRITWKQNSSVTYVSGTGTSAAAATYSVNSSKAANTPVCWNGGSEVLLSTPAGVSPAYNNCEQYQTCAASNPVVTTPVFMITALSVTTNGSRQMVQAEAALNPPSISVSPCGISDPYGFFAYGNGCASPPFLLQGNASVDGFNSALGPYSASNHTAASGTIGSNGAVSLGGTSTNVGGKVYVPNIGSPPGPGACPVDFAVTGNPTYGGLVQSTPLTAPTVTIPSNTSVTDLNVSGNQTIVPGTNYRNVNVSGNGTQLTLTAPGTYNFNSLTIATHAILTISPANKAVTINITGNGTTTPITMGSHATIVNTSGVSDNIQINYAGTGSLTMQGGPSAYAVVNAPYAAVVMGGGSDWYGTIMANTIDDHGGINLHFDTADTTLSGATAATATANATGSYNTLSFRSVPY